MLMKSLTPEQLRSAIRELDEDHKRQEEEYKRNRSAAETLLRSLLPLQPSMPRIVDDATTQPEGFVLVHAVEKMVASEPDRQWTVREVIAAFEYNGIVVTSNDLPKAISNALARLVKKGKVVVAQEGSGSSPTKYQWKRGAIARGHEKGKA